MVQNKNILALVAQVAALKGNRFASLTYTAKGSGEVARHTIQLGFSYHNAVEKSRNELVARIEAGEFKTELEKQAATDVRASLEKTLAAHAIGQQNPDYTKKDVYVSLFNGLNVNSNDGSLKLFGLTVAKVVLVNGVFKEVKSAPLTLAKAKITRTLAVGKFREYAIDENTLAKARLNGETIEME